MQVKKFTPDEFDALPLLPQKKFHNNEMDIDEISIEEDFLESMEPWEQAFELGVQMASDELDEAYEN